MSRSTSGFQYEHRVGTDAISWTGTPGGRIGLESRRMWRARGRRRSRVQLRGVQLAIPVKYLSGDVRSATGYESEVQKRVVGYRQT